MVRRLFVAAALAAAACNPDLPAKLPCSTNDNCPSGLGCNLSAQICVALPGCGGDFANGSNYGCLSGSPTAPSVSLNGSGANITWDPGNTFNNASGFAVLRADSPTGPFAVIGTVTPYSAQPQSTFTDPGPLAVGKTYWYEVATSWPDNVVGPPSPATSFVDSHWSPRASMSSGRYGFATAVFNGVIYAVGGYHDTALTTVEAYDPAADAWTTKASMPTARTYLAAGAVNGIVYAVGGGCNCNGGPANTGALEAYDPVANTWFSKLPMPTSRSNLAAAVVSGTLYAIGGSPGGSTVEAYDPTSNTWTTKAPMPTARFDLAAEVVNGIIYVVGGVGSGGATRLATVEAYDPASNSWTTKTPMPTARQGPAVGVVGGILYAVGGTTGTSGSGANAVVEAYDPVANSWSAKDPMSTARAFPGAAAVNGSLFAIGGHDNAGIYLFSVEEFAP